MGRMVSIEDRKTERLAAVLERRMAPQLHMGSVTAPLSDVADVDRWRRAARMAGRRLGWRVRTGISERGGYVWVIDIREPPAEVLEAHQRETMGRLEQMVSEGEAKWRRPRLVPPQA